MHSNKRAMWGITAVVVALMVVLLVQSHKLNTRLAGGSQQISSLTEQTEAEEQRTEDIKELQDYMQSDAYKEKVAKEKLGLVRDGEIVFKEEK